MWRPQPNETPHDALPASHRFSCPCLQPPHLPLQSFGEQLCQDPNQAADKLVEAMAAGGEEARIAVAALLSYSCPGGPPQMQATFDAFTNATELQEPETALRWV